MIIFALLIVIPVTIALYKKSKDLQFKIRVEEEMNSIKISNRFLEINNSGPIEFASQLILTAIDVDNGLSSSLFEGPKLVLKVSELTCSECYEQEIENLKKYQEKIGIRNILVLAKYNDIRFMLSFKRTNQIPFNILKVLHDTITPIDTLNIPYYFVLNHGKEVSKIYIPNRNCSNESFAYYEMIIRDYFDQMNSIVN